MSEQGKAEGILLLSRGHSRQVAKEYGSMVLVGFIHTAIPSFSSLYRSYQIVRASSKRYQIVSFPDRIL